MSDSHLMSTYARQPLSFSHGNGVWLTAEDGRRYLDLTAGIGVNAMGHCHPHLVEALNRQAGKLWHLSNLYEIPQQERLADRLCAASFADRVFFTNSGAEANETALKLARRHFDLTGQPERWRTIVFDGAFHGRTLATIVAGDGEKYREGYAPHAPGFDRAQFNDIDSVRALIGPETAAILIEPVQGEGGVRCADPAFMRALRALADEHGLLLMVDEVQCGNGRTGKLYAHEWSGITPDVLTTAKGLGGGFPLSACMATERVANAFGPGNHGTTFGGNPLAMAVGNAVLDILTAPGFMDHVCTVAEHLRAGLSNLATRYPQHISEPLRGLGLMIGLPAHTPNTRIVQACQDHGLMVLTARDNIIRLLPALVITPAEVDQALQKMAAALDSLAA
ncbi:aspartate aminotransferase family protein [Castellaniella sp.]|uniref:aspartate aminotransferase family protein n=1 Tax=Castellaniella sp. TaxID=1955812 RepID=UPI003568F08A